MKDIDKIKIIEKVIKKKNFRRNLKESAQICEREGVETGFAAFFDLRSRRLKVDKVTRGECRRLLLGGSIPSYVIDREGLLFALHFHPDAIDWSLDSLLPSIQDIQGFFPPRITGIKWIWDTPKSGLEEEGLNRLERDLEWREEVLKWKEELKEKEEERELKFRVVEAIAGVSKKRNSLEVVVLFLWLKNKPRWKEILEEYPGYWREISFSKGIEILKNVFEIRLKKFQFLLSDSCSC